MSALYSVTHVKTEVKSFYFSEKEYGFVGLLIQTLVDLLHSMTLLKESFPNMIIMILLIFIPGSKQNLERQQMLF
jgi:hypothetical protein